VLDNQKMREQAQKYILEIDVKERAAYLLKHKGGITLSTERAIEWVNAGIDSLEGYSKKEMLEILKKWLTV
jgi:tRNA(Phe) wybutosine-synthesizing methylase Tyw3